VSTHVETLDLFGAATDGITLLTKDQLRALPSAARAGAAALRWAVEMADAGILSPDSLYGRRECPDCGQSYIETRGRHAQRHAPGCDLARLIGGAS
jgi:hypothetical protein